LTSPAPLLNEVEASILLEASKTTPRGNTRVLVMESKMAGLPIRLATFTFVVCWCVDMVWKIPFDGDGDVPTGWNV
jgi:hypothetical protein